MQGTVAPPPAAPDALAAYAARSAGRDEMLDPWGATKPVWQPFMDHVTGLAPHELSRRFARGDQYLRDAGVLFRQYDETAPVDREWPLSPIPVILAEAEWREISAGLIQRADLLETVVRDLYGDNELVARGHLPATLLGQNPAWLREMVGIPPGNGNFLNLLSFEIGRGPDGKWWVISDIVEAPSAVGFAIENRVAMSRVFPNFFAAANVHRLAGFFQDFQRALFDLRGRSGGQIGLLSAGPAHQNYAEHAYIARYLGLLLVEGEDLVVQDGKAMVRTVDGPKPLSLLWSRVPGAAFDPLELDQGSTMGTPGLLETLRAQSLGMVNMPGSGVLETRALMAFLPRIARELLGQELILPNVATWWCGQPGEREYVIAQRDTMMVGSAFSTVPLMEDPQTTVLGDGQAAYGDGQAPSGGGFGADFAGGSGGGLAGGSGSDPVPMSGDGGRRQALLADLMQGRGRELVGQEAITLSTTPTWQDGALVARPMAVRLFLARGRDGWRVMPGGYARISAGEDAKALAMQSGGKVADVWVVSDSPVPRRSLLDGETGGLGRPSDRDPLPSRAADNLFWLGRYVERAEQNMRLFRAHFARVSDGAPEDAPLLAHLRRTVMDDVAPDPSAMAARFGVPLGLALQSAGKIRDRVSPDGMMALRALSATAADLDARSVAPDEIAREVSVLLRQITGFAGLVHENMYRSQGWRFLSLGISLERASNMAQLLAFLACDAAPDTASGAGSGGASGATRDALSGAAGAAPPEGALDLALELGDSVVAHRARFSILATPASVIDMLATDDQNPRSIRYHVSRARQHIAGLPGQTDTRTPAGSHRLSPAARRVLVLETTLATSAPGTLTRPALQKVQADILDIAAALSAAHLV